MVLLSNGIIDIENEWTKSSTEIQFLFSNYLNGFSYFLFETLDILSGDVIVKKDTSLEGGIDISNFGVIDSYDKLLHKIDVKQSGGVLNEGDEIYIFRGATDQPISGFGTTGCYQQSVGSYSCTIVDGSSELAPLCATAGCTFGKIRRKDSIKDSIFEFQYKSEKINPYSGIDSSGVPEGDYYSLQNLCGLTGTVLYKHITGSLTDSIGSISTELSTHTKNNDKKKIKLMNPKLISKISNEIAVLMKGNVPRGTTTILEQR